MRSLYRGYSPLSLVYGLAQGLRTDKSDRNVINYELLSHCQNAQRRKKAKKLQNYNIKALLANVGLYYKNFI